MYKNEKMAQILAYFSLNLSFEFNVPFERIRMPFRAYLIGTHSRHIINVPRMSLAFLQKKTCKILEKRETCKRTK